MKKLLALLMAALIIFSFAGCKIIEEKQTVIEKTNSWTTTLYFGDSEGMKVIAEKREIKGNQADTESIKDMDVPGKAKLIIEELIKGSAVPGRTTCIPSSTNVKSVQQPAPEILVVDLSKEFETDHIGGSTGINMTFAPLVLSLTELDGVEYVWFLIDSEPIQDFKGHMNLSNMLDRASYTSYISE